MGVNFGIWTATVVVGAVFGIFVRPLYIAVLAGVFELAALAGLLVYGVLGHGDLATVFGIAAMAVPLLGALVSCGALIGSAIRKRLSRSTQDNAP